jgi:hypothetical protein
VSQAWGEREGRPGRPGDHPVRRLWAAVRRRWGRRGPDRCLASIAEQAELRDALARAVAERDGWKAIAHGLLPGDRPGRGE